MATPWHRYKWFAASVFVGVLLASVLSKHMPTLAAWFIGGAVMGTAPGEPLAQGKRVVLALTIGVVAALAYWLAELIGL